MSQVAIHAHHLGKRYAIGRSRRSRTARDAVAGGVSRAWRSLNRVGPAPSDETVLWALDDVSFQIESGEVVGIIGRNGAGKSTLLKVLSRITEPTVGHVDVAGRVGSLLEVGTGFHEDLTGRENTYLNGAILGMTRREIDRKFDEIVAFAEIERFIDTPVKHYSSGMYMRLAFAVAAHLDTEILLVDEVLAVGDAEFQKKCLGKMDDISRCGRAVLFVSHNLDAIQRLCGRGLLLHRGRVTAAGSIDEAVRAYRLEAGSSAPGHFDVRNRRGTGWARFTQIRVVDENGRTIGSQPCDRDLLIEMTIEVAHSSHAGSLRGLIVHLVACAEDGRPLVSLMSADDTGAPLPASRHCVLRVLLSAPTFVPGRYRLNAFLGVPSVEHVDEIADALEFEIAPPEHPWRPFALTAASGHVCRTGWWEALGAAAAIGGRS